MNRWVVGEVEFHAEMCYTGSFIIPLKGNKRESDNTKNKAGVLHLPYVVFFVH